MLQPDTGPYLAVAVFCKGIKRDHDGAPSIERIIDTLTAPPPKEGKTASFKVMLYLQFRSGSYVGEVTLALNGIKPDGTVAPATTFPLRLRGPGTNSVIAGPFELCDAEEGMHHYDLYLDDQFVTRLSLNVVFQVPKLRKMQNPRSVN